MLRKNDLVTLKTEALTNSGSGLSRYGDEKFCVFVPGTAPGDECLVRIIKVKKNYAVGKIEKIIAPSPVRIGPDCPVAGRCGGCAFRHISYEAELEYKRQTVRDAFLRIGHIEADVSGVSACPSRDRYRNKAQYPVGFEKGRINIGFYAPMSHRVVDIKDCLLQPEEFARIVAAVREWMMRFGVTPYDETTGKGYLRHIYLRKGFATGEIMVCAVVNSDRPKRSDEFTAAVLNACSGVRSVVFDYNTADTNVILGDRYDVVYGTDGIYDELCGIRVKLSPLSFYQVNHDGAERLYGIAAELAAPGKDDTVCDLYCGAGTIGLSMASKAKKIIGVEIVPEAVEDAKTNARINDITNAEFICADAGAAAKQLEEKGVRPDVVIVDPPRKGCSPELLAAVDAMSPDRLVYVSCDPATLARDCAELYKTGWRVDEVRPVDMFPGTTHVETVVLMTRTETSKTVS